MGKRVRYRIVELKKRWKKWGKVKGVKGNECVRVKVELTQLLE